MHVRVYQILNGRQIVRYPKSQRKRSKESVAIGLSLVGHGSILSTTIGQLPSCTISLFHWTL